MSRSRAARTGGVAIRIPALRERAEVFLGLPGDVEGGLDMLLDMRQHIVIGGDNGDAAALGSAHGGSRTNVHRRYPWSGWGPLVGGLCQIFTAKGEIFIFLVRRNGLAAAAAARSVLGS